MTLKRIIIAGGGTGGHIFPAIAVANALKKIDREIEVLFVGAKGKMEMEKVPQAGYSIVGLDIAGFNRKAIWKNWSLPFKLLRSMFQVRKIFKDFKPDAAFGVGGYSSYPVLRFAQQQGIPTFLHEANSFAGKSNILLGKRANLIMVATAGMEKFFPSAHLLRTGNPVRSEISGSAVLREEALEFFGLKTDRPTVLVIGGSLGARSINMAMANGIQLLTNDGIQVIWQTGKGNLNLVDPSWRKRKDVCVTEFISKMNYAYAAADVIVSRAGAIALAEICTTAKPAVLVPFPQAAEDHQRVNARVLVDAGAAILVEDDQAGAKLVQEVKNLIGDEELMKRFSEAAASLSIKDADVKIASAIIQKMKEQHD